MTSPASGVVARYVTKASTASTPRPARRTAAMKGAVSITVCMERIYGNAVVWSRGIYGIAAGLPPQGARKVWFFATGRTRHARLGVENAPWKADKPRFHFPKSRKGVDRVSRFASHL